MTTHSPLEDAQPATSRHLFELGRVRRALGAWSAWASACGIVAMVLAGCKGSTMACTPGASTSCVGPAGCSGFQVCGDEGASFGACMCERADAGLAVDAGPGPSDAGPGPSDAGSDGGMDLDGGASVDAGAPGDAGPPPPAIGIGASRDALIPADYGCLGSRPAPPGGSASSFSVVVTDFFNGEPVGGLTVQHFPDNTLTLGTTCGAGCSSAVTSTLGEAPFSGAVDSWFAARMLAGIGVLESADADYLTVSHANLVTASSVHLPAVRVWTRATVHALIDEPVDTSRAWLMGSVVDCADEPVANARIRLFDSDGEIVLDGGGGSRAYFTNGDFFPTGSEERSHVDGRYGVLNVPVPSDEMVRVEAWGVRTAGTPEVRLGCEAIRVGVDSVSILDVGPTRADAPSGC